MYDTSKRAFDLAVSVLGLTFLAPIFLMIAIAIKLDSIGPVFYTGKRVGRYGRLFRIIKFRTMHPKSEPLGTTTALNDPRITRVGRLLRKYKVDELPQLINVIVGDMSLVGPRPEVEEHTSVYSEEEKLILNVLPGITDYSSIRFSNLAETLGSDNAHEIYVTKVRAEKNRLRLQYVRDRSFGKDLVIIAETLIVIARKTRLP